VTVSGLQGINTGRTIQAISCTIGSEYSSDNKIHLPTAYVLPKLTSFKRWQRIRRKDWPHLRELQLADPDYDKSSAIDVVLEADIYAMLMKDGFRNSRPGKPIAHHMMRIIRSAVC